MRKLAWGLVICGLFVMAATAGSVRYAARHPHTPFGRVMHHVNDASARLCDAMRR